MTTAIGTTRSGAHTLSLLDRLLDETVAPVSNRAGLRQNLRRDLENLLNTRRSWLSTPAHLPELARSVIGYGLPDFSVQEMTSGDNTSWLCEEIARTITRFEPRLGRVQVQLQDPLQAPLQSNQDSGNRLLHLRIDAVLLTDIQPEPVSFHSELEIVTLTMKLDENRQ